MAVANATLNFRHQIALAGRVGFLGRDRLADVNMNRGHARQRMVAWPGLVRSVDPHGNSGTLARFANAEKPGFRGWTSPSGERVPSGKISTISPRLALSVSFSPESASPSRSIGMASSDWISSRKGANAK